MKSIMMGPGRVNIDDKYAISLLGWEKQCREKIHNAKVSCATRGISS